MTRKRGKAAVIDALITSGGFGDFGKSTPPTKPPEHLSAKSVEVTRPMPEPVQPAQGDGPEQTERLTEAPIERNARIPKASVQHDKSPKDDAPVERESASSADQNEGPAASQNPLAMARNDLGPIQAIHRKVMVVDDLKQLPEFQGGMLRMFVPCSLVSPWALHDRRLIGEPDISDIYESILSEGQEEACVTRLNENGKTIELIAGFRRFCAVQNTSSAYLLVDLYHPSHLTDKTAWIEMTRENNLDRKKSIPISAQVESDQKALSKGLFKNLSELSKAAGKAENWARQNKHLYDQIPEKIRKLCSSQQMASLTAPHYRKVGKLLKDGGKWRDDRIDTIAEHWNKLSDQSDKFPLKQIESLLEARSTDVKALSNGAVKVRVDHNGNINLTVSRGLSHQQISALVKTVQSTIESL